MSIVTALECITCYTEYDTESHKPIVGTCGHSMCETCKHQMFSNRCPMCNREEAFAITIINDELLHLVTQIKRFGEGAGTPQFSRSGEGICPECSLRSRKLLVCIICALNSGLIKQDSKKHVYMLSTENKNAEHVFQEAKNHAICGYCAVDGLIHEGHRTMLLAALANVSEEKKRDNHIFETTKSIEPSWVNAKKVFLEKNTVDPVLVVDRNQTLCEPSHIGLFNPVDHAWTPIELLSDPKSNYAVASHKSAVFIIGGRNNGIWLQSVEMYDRAKNLSSHCNPMKRPRTRPSACFHNHKLYVAGGYDSAYMNSVEIFDLSNGNWSDGPLLQKPRADAPMVSFNGELFVLGGFNGINYQDTIEKLYEQTNQFEIFANMGGGRAGFGACEFRGRIYIAGGWNRSDNTLRTVRSFDPKTKTWRDEPSMNIERKYFTLHATNEAIYAIRGWANNWEVIEKIEQFDPDQMKWEVING
ncbi:unnamed protein product [Caenorhabditis brenneri]